MVAVKIPRIPKRMGGGLGDDRRARSLIGAGEPGGRMRTTPLPEAKRHLRSRWRFVLTALRFL